MIELIDFMMQQFLPGVTLNMLYSEINHIRHFIKIQFVNKGIEFINLPSIFKDKSLLFLLILKIRNPLSFVISIINLFLVLFLTITK